MELPQCRLCLESDFWWNLCSPCACKGSIRYTHTSCLERYEAYRRTQEQPTGSCPVCAREYAYINRQALSSFLIHLSIYITIAYQPATEERYVCQAISAIAFLCKIIPYKDINWYHHFKIYKWTTLVFFTLLLLPVPQIVAAILTCILSLYSYSMSDRTGGWFMAHAIFVQMFSILFTSTILNRAYIFLFASFYLEAMTVLSE